MDITPELIESSGKAVVAVMAGLGAFVATIASTITAFYTWKNRYELDKLYSQTVRKCSDGSPGPMRSHPRMMVKIFRRLDKNLTDAPPPYPRTDSKPSAEIKPHDWPTKEE